jgi:small subunit ribosomal protein S17
MANKTDSRRKLEGVITGNQMDKTVKVTIEVPMRHPVYKKIVTRRKVFFAHTEDQHELGDKVMIKESKPYSKNVRWVVINKN